MEEAKVVEGSFWKPKAWILSLREKCPDLELFWSAFSCIRTEYGEISLRIQSECGKMRTRINSNTDTFYAMLSSTLSSLCPALKEMVYQRRALTLLKRRNFWSYSIHFFEIILCNHRKIGISYPLFSNLSNFSSSSLRLIDFGMPLI